jgi:hypothetical protein
VQWLVNIAQEVGNPLERIGTSQVGALIQCSTIHVPDTVSEYARLICDGTDHTATFRAVVCIVEMTVLWCPIVRVYPVPLV